MAIPCLSSCCVYTQYHIQQNVCTTTSYSKSSQRDAGMTGGYCPPRPPLSTCRGKKGQKQVKKKTFKNKCKN